MVEIDPVVHEFAVKYFSLPRNYNAVIADAVSYTSELANKTDEKFDYIVHDVFTGGAEPVDLFTVEFISNLRTILKPGGVIAIVHPFPSHLFSPITILPSQPSLEPLTDTPPQNYAGDLLLPSAHIIVRTILSIFPTCRIFREGPPPVPSPSSPPIMDFTNMVIFCTNSDSPLTFRTPNEKDMLGSGARKMYLLPKHEGVFLIPSFPNSPFLFCWNLGRVSCGGQRHADDGNLSSGSRYIRRVNRRRRRYGLIIRKWNGDIQKVAAE